MKKIWLILICAAMITMTAACGSKSPADDSAGKGEASAQQEETSAQEEQAQEVQYEEYSRLGMTFLLPEGTQEEESKPGQTYNYRNGDLFIMMNYVNDYEISDDDIAEYAQSAAEGFDNGELGEIHKCTVDGRPAYQFDCTGTLQDIDLIVTLTVFNVPVGTMAFLVSNQTMDKEDYSAINDVLISSIDIDESVYEAVEETPDYYVKGRKAVTGECTVRITGHKVLRPGEGANAYGSDPVIVFEFKMKNTSGKKMTPAVQWPVIAEVVQDNDPNAVNKLQPAVLLDGSAQDLLKEIKPGGTVRCREAYTLTDLKTPVEVIFRNGVIGEELGSMKFKVK